MMVPALEVCWHDGGERDGGRDRQRLTDPPVRSSGRVRYEISAAGAAGAAD
jgi:hypothetical protein